MSSRWIAAALLLSACGKPDPPAVEVKKETAAKREPGAVTIADASVVTVETVAQRSIPEVLRANGRLTVNENRTWRVGSQTDGRVVRVFAAPGDRVAARFVLARMHSHEIHEARAAYAKAKAEVARVEAAIGFATRVRDRARRLQQLGAGSVEQAEQAEAALRNSQTEMQNARTEFERARVHLVEFLGVPAEEPEHHQEGDHSDDSDLIPIRAPAAGTVIERTVTAGTVVQPGGQMFVLADLSTVWMLASVAEDQMARVRPGAGARVTVAAFADRGFAGRVGRIGDQLDPQTRTVEVRIELANTGALLKPEMYGTAEISVGGSKPALFIKEAAVQEVNGQPTVFIRRSDRAFEARPVDLGRTIDGAREVLSGLAAGDAIVVRGSFLLKSQLLKASLEEE